jgi:hypothetical protein
MAYTEARISNEINQKKEDGQLYYEVTTLRFRIRKAETTPSYNLAVRRSHWPSLGDHVSDQVDLSA